MVLVLIHGRGLAEPMATLHATRAGARARLLIDAAALLFDRQGYVPARLRGGGVPSVADLVDALADVGLTAAVDDLPVGS